MQSGSAKLLANLPKVKMQVLKMKVTKEILADNYRITSKHDCGRERNKITGCKLKQLTTQNAYFFTKHLSNT